MTRDEKLTALVERWRDDAAKTIARPFDNESLVAEAEQIAEAGIFTICADDLAAILAEPDMTGVLANELSVARFELQRTRVALKMAQRAFSDIGNTERVDEIEDALDPGWRERWDIGAAVDRALLNASPAPVNAARPETEGAGACDCCDGRGEVGGLLPDGGGYQTDPCPHCDGAGIQPAPPPLDPAVVAELERLTKECGAVFATGDGWTELGGRAEGHWPAILAALRQGTGPISPDEPVEGAGDVVKLLRVVLQVNDDVNRGDAITSIRTSYLRNAIAEIERLRTPSTVTDAMVEAFAKKWWGLRVLLGETMKRQVIAALTAALQAQRGE